MNAFVVSWLIKRRAEASGALLCTERVSAIENIRPMTRCHAPIDVRRVGLDHSKLCDPRVVGRKLAYRVGCGGIAGEGEGLATAAAEIQLAARAACARLPHVAKLKQA